MATIGRFLLVVAGLTLAQSAWAAGDAYKCIAADGVIEYRELPIENMTCKAIRGPARGSTNPEAEMQKLRDKVKAQETAKAETTAAGTNASNCERARKNLEVLESDSDVVQADAEGKKSVLDADGRKSMAAQTRKDIEYWCTQ